MGKIFGLFGEKLETKEEEAPKKLCTVTFLYTAKGVANGKAQKKETVFAWLTDGCTTEDLVKQLFNPAEIKRELCIVHDVIVLGIPTVKPTPQTPK